ncbi:LysR family transcriptional regulator [Paenibacillus sp. P26]|nr:LysR family transcriptional regulator [Paenibacillus sp. P26]
MLFFDTLAIRVHREEGAYDRQAGGPVFPYVHRGIRRKSFSRAAERLGYVQSTVTTQMRLLEEAASCKLFDRLPRGVEPTEAGRRLADYAYRFFKLGQELEEAPLVTGEPRGTVRLRMLESFGAALMDEVLPGFLSAYPAVELQLESGFHKDTLEAVVSERADLGIVPLDPGRPDLIFEPPLDDELIWVASPPGAEEVNRRRWEAVKAKRLFGLGVRLHVRRGRRRASQEAPGSGARPGGVRFARNDQAGGPSAGSGWRRSRG